MNRTCIVLTPLQISDATEMYPLLSDPEIYRFIPSRRPASLDELQSKYERQAKGVSPDGKDIWCNWIIRDRAAGHPLGFVQATIQMGTTTASIGYVLSPKYWKQGFAQAAVTEMIGLVKAMGIKSFLASAAPGNTVSLKLLSRLGFSRSNEASTIAGDVLMELSEGSCGRTPTSREFVALPEINKMGS